MNELTRGLASFVLGMAAMMSMIGIAHKIEFNLKTRYTQNFFWLILIAILLTVFTCNTAHSAEPNYAVAEFTDAEDLGRKIDSVRAVRDTVRADSIMISYHVFGWYADENIKTIQAFPGRIIEIRRRVDVHAMITRQPRAEIYYDKIDRDRKQGTFQPGTAYTLEYDASYPKKESFPGVALITWRWE